MTTLYLTEPGTIVRYANKKLHPQGDGVFGHGESGMGHGKEITNAPCPMPQATGETTSSTHSWDGVSRRFR